jgi:hypothetical protein
VGFLSNWAAPLKDLPQINENESLIGFSVAVYDNGIPGSPTAYTHICRFVWLCLHESCSRISPIDS